MLSLTSVSAGYGSFQALFGVSLEVPQGEAVGVIGPNGAGKTTLMRVISGLIPLREGAVTLEGSQWVVSRRIAWSSRGLPMCRKIAGCLRV